MGATQWDRARTPGVSRRLSRAGHTPQVRGLDGAHLEPEREQQRGVHAAGAAALHPRGRPRRPQQQGCDLAGLERECGPPPRHGPVGHGWRRADGCWVFLGPLAPRVRVHLSAAEENGLCTAIVQPCMLGMRPRRDAPHFVPSCDHPTLGSVCARSFMSLHIRFSPVHKHIVWGLAKSLEPHQNFPRGGLNDITEPMGVACFGCSPPSMLVMPCVLI